MAQIDNVRLLCPIVQAESCPKLTQMLFKAFECSIALATYETALPGGTGCQKMAASGRVGACTQAGTGHGGGLREQHLSRPELVQSVAWFAIGPL